MLSTRLKRLHINTAKLNNHPCPLHSRSLPRIPLYSMTTASCKTHVPCYRTHRPRRDGECSPYTEREDEPGRSGLYSSKSGCRTRMGAQRSVQASPLPLHVSTAAR